MQISAFPRHTLYTERQTSSFTCKFSHHPHLSWWVFCAMWCSGKNKVKEMGLTVNDFLTWREIGYLVTFSSLQFHAYAVCVVRCYSGTFHLHRVFCASWISLNNPPCFLPWCFLQPSSLGCAGGGESLSTLPPARWLQRNLQKSSVEPIFLDTIFTFPCTLFLQGCCFHYLFPRVQARK